jgi:hypothetical protein
MVEGRREGKRKKGEGRSEKGEGRREKGEGRREKGEGRKKGEARREKGEGRKEEVEWKGRGEGRREKGEGRQEKVGEGREGRREKAKGEVRIPVKPKASCKFWVSLNGTFSGTGKVAPFKKIQLKSTWIISPVVESNKIFSQCLSPNLENIFKNILEESLPSSPWLLLLPSPRFRNVISEWGSTRCPALRF